MDGIFRIEVKPDEVKFIRAVIKAVTKEARQENLELTGHDLAGRLVRSFENGERDFTRLKALVLGAERAPTRPGSRRAN